MKRVLVAPSPFTRKLVEQGIDAAEVPGVRAYTTGNLKTATSAMDAMYLQGTPFDALLYDADLLADRDEVGRAVAYYREQTLASPNKYKPPWPWALRNYRAEQNTLEQQSFETLDLFTRRSLASFGCRDAIVVLLGGRGSRELRYQKDRYNTVSDSEKVRRLDGACNLTASEGASQQRMVSLLTRVGMILRLKDKEATPATEVRSARASTSGRHDTRVFDNTPTEDRTPNAGLWRAERKPM